MDPRDSGVMTFRRGAEQLYQAWWRIDGERFTGHERSTRAQAEDDLDVIRQVIESEQLEEATEAVKVVAKNKTDTELRDLLKEIAKMNKRDAEKFGTTETGVLLEDIEKGFREAKVMPTDVTFVDCGDPNNVKIFLTDEDGDWEFEVMIVARRTP